MSGKVFNELFGTRKSKNVKESETKPTVQTDTASQWKLMESVPVPLTRLPKELLENEKEKAKLVSTGTSTADQIDGERSDLQLRGKEHENGSGSRKEGERQVEEERTQEEVAGSTQEDQRSDIPEEEKGSGTEEEGSGIQDERRKQENIAVLKIGDVVKNPNLMDQLACLDRGHSVVKNWKHLAYQLDIPHDIQKKFETPFELSPTLQLFQNLSTADPELNIEKLKEVLKGIHRNDIIKELKDIPDTTTVVELFGNNLSLLDSIALMLDSAKKPVEGWKSLAKKLISTGPMFREFEAQLQSKSTQRLFWYLRTTKEFNKLTVADLKGHLEDMKRRDVLHALINCGVQDDEFLAKVFSPDSDLLNNVSNLLNKETPGVKNWRRLANKLDVPREVYEEFDTDLNSPKSPTKMMLEWLASERPGMTLDKLRTAVDKIKRGDAFNILKDFSSKKCSE